MRTRLPFPFSSFSCPCFLVLVFLLHFFNEILFLLDLARYHLDRIWRSWTGCGNMVECMKMGNGTGFFCIFSGGFLFLKAILGTLLEPCQRFAQNLNFGVLFAKNDNLSQ